MTRQGGHARYVGVDQYGHTYWLGPHPRKELQALLCRSRVSKMYRDDTKRGYDHVGYVVGKLWIEIFELSP
jgi:hypothetical protein